MKLDLTRLATGAVVVWALAGPGTADATQDLHQLTSSAYHQAESAANDLDRIDAKIGGMPPGPERAEMVKQRALLEAQLRRELESIRRLARKIDELERRVVFEAHHGMKMPGPPIQAHPAGPEPVVTDMTPVPAAEPAEEGGGMIIAPAPVITPLTED